MQLEEKLAVAKQAIVSEQAKSTRMNQETIANLQTLMIELEMIETKNQEVCEVLHVVTDIEPFVHRRAFSRTTR